MIEVNQSKCSKYDETPCKRKESSIFISQTPKAEIDGSFLEMGPTISTLFALLVSDNVLRIIYHRHHSSIHWFHSSSYHIKIYKSTTTLLASLQPHDIVLINNLLHLYDYIQHNPRSDYSSVNPQNWSKIKINHSSKLFHFFSHQFISAFQTKHQIWCSIHFPIIVSTTNHFSNHPISLFLSICDCVGVSLR